LLGLKFEAVIAVFDIYSFIVFKTIRDYNTCPMCKLNGYKTYVNLKEKYDNRTERKLL